MYCKTLNIRTRTIIWTICTTFDSVLYLYWNTWFKINIWPILWIFHHFNVPYVYDVYISDLLNWVTGWNFFSCTTLKWFTRVSLAYSLSCNSILTNQFFKINFITFNFFQDIYTWLSAWMKWQHCEPLKLVVSVHVVFNVS